MLAADDSGMTREDGEGTNEELVWFGYDRGHFIPREFAGILKTFSNPVFLKAFRKKNRLWDQITALLSHRKQIFKKFNGTRSIFTTEILTCSVNFCRRPVFVTFVHAPF